MHPVFCLRITVLGLHRRAEVVTNLHDVEAGQVQVVDHRALLQVIYHNLEELSSLIFVLHSPHNVQSLLFVVMEVLAAS